MKIYKNTTETINTESVWCLCVISALDDFQSFASSLDALKKDK